MLRLRDARRNRGKPSILNKYDISFLKSTYFICIYDLINWSEDIAKTGRETQKQFLMFCLNFFRQALLLNYNASELVYLEPKTDTFKLEKFAPFIHDANIMEISDEIQDAIYHIERNGNSKIILTDLSIKLTRLLHKKSA